LLLFSHDASCGYLGGVVYPIMVLSPGRRHFLGRPLAEQSGIYPSEIRQFVLPNLFDGVSGTAAVVLQKFNQLKVTSKYCRIYWSVASPPAGICQTVHIRAVLDKYTECFRVSTPRSCVQHRAACV